MRDLFSTQFFSSKLLLLLFSVMYLDVAPSRAQDVSIHKDTSYTTFTAYKKYVKTYPDIKLAQTDGESETDRFLNIPYKNLGYRHLSADLFQPKNNHSQSFPAVVLVHGGGWISGDKTLLHPIADHLARQGYVAISIEYRLSPDATYPAALNDIFDAIAWTHTQADRFSIDTTRIALLGSSAGGQLAALAGVTGSKKRDSAATRAVEAIVDIDGVLAFIHPESKEGKVASKWLGGSKEEHRDVWIDASASTHVHSDMPPVLFIGSSKPRFLAGRKEMTEFLNQHDIKHETQIFEDAPHSFWLFHPWFEPTMNSITTFLYSILK